MSKSNQEELDEALEHHSDHPVTQEEFEIDEEWQRLFYERMRKSQELRESYLKQQSEIWGTK